jgi:hypothetical protein
VETAALRDFDPANVRLGHSLSDISDAMDEDPGDRTFQ